MKFNRRIIFHIVERNVKINSELLKMPLLRLQRTSVGFRAFCASSLQTTCANLQTQMVRNDK